MGASGGLSKKISMKNRNLQLQQRAKEQAVSSAARADGGNPDDYEAYSQESFDDKTGKRSVSWMGRKKGTLASGSNLQTPAMTAGEQKTFLGRTSTLLGG